MPAPPSQRRLGTAIGSPALHLKLRTYPIFNIKHFGGADSAWAPKINLASVGVSCVRRQQRQPGSRSHPATNANMFLPTCCASTTTLTPLKISSSSLPLHLIDDRLREALCQRESVKQYSVRTHRRCGGWIYESNEEASAHDRKDRSDGFHAHRLTAPTVTGVSGGAKTVLFKNAILVGLGRRLTRRQ